MRIKKPLVPILLILNGVIVGVLISSAIFAFTGYSLFAGTPRNVVPSDATGNTALTALAYSVLEQIRDDDFLALSQVAHPELGVVFTPYSTINLSTDRRFSADQIAMFDTDTTTYMWGVYNGSGEPMLLTPTEYFELFIPAESCLNASVIGVNQLVRSGNALENIADVFPNALFVDFHMPGSQEDTPEDYDWSSLRLGFEEYEGELRLVIIVHSRWTA